MVYSFDEFLELGRTKPAPAGDGLARLGWRASSSWLCVRARRGPQCFRCCCHRRCCSRAEYLLPSLLLLLLSKTANALLASCVFYGLPESWEPLHDLMPTL